jgi:hypothetical protein
MAEQDEIQNGSSQPMSSKQKMSRAKLVIIISMAFGPILAAYIVFFNFPELAPISRTNEGTLISPPIQGGELISTHSKWTLIIAVARSCDEVCRDVLHLSRQIHISLGKNTPRVQRVIVTGEELSFEFSAFLQDEHGNTEIIRVGDNTFMDQLQQVIGEAPLPSMVFLMDPNGNVMMSYPPEKGGKPMLKDLKLLLKLSNIG